MIEEMSYNIEGDRAKFKKAEDMPKGLRTPNNELKKIKDKSNTLKKTNNKQNHVR